MVLSDDDLNLGGNNGSASASVNGSDVGNNHISDYVDENNNCDDNHRRRRSRYSIEFKQRVIDYKKRNPKKSISHCAECFCVDRRLVSRWLKIDNKIEKMKLKRYVFKVRTERDFCKYPYMERRLLEWIHEKRQIGGCISGIAIKEKAREIYKEVYQNSEEGHMQFEASSGWLANFCKRRDLVLRRITTSGREMPKDCIAIIKKFFSAWQIITSKDGFDLNTLINMDETSIYLDYPSNYTYETKGRRRIPATTTGSERTRLSAAFSATAGGIKLPILVLVPRKNDLPDFEPPDNVIVIYKTGATFNDDIICEYLETVLNKYKQDRNYSKLILLVDAARCHLTEKVNKKLRDVNIERKLIPPRFTNLLQPADVAWFATLKNSYHKKWNDWFLNAEKTFTRFNNARSPGYVKCIQWLSEIWEAFDSELIARSFEKCGIIHQYNLHTALQFILRDNTIVHDFIDEIQPADNIDGFDDSNIFDESPVDIEAPRNQSTPNNSTQSPILLSSHLTEPDTALITNEQLNDSCVRYQATPMQQPDNFNSQFDAPPMQQPQNLNSAYDAPPMQQPQNLNSAYDAPPMQQPQNLNLQFEAPPIQQLQNFNSQYEAPPIQQLQNFNSQYLAPTFQPTHINSFFPYQTPLYNNYQAPPFQLSPHNSFTQTQSQTTFQYQQSQLSPQILPNSTNMHPSPSKNEASGTPNTPIVKRKPGRPKGSKNKKNKST